MILDAKLSEKQYQGYELLRDTKTEGVLYGGAASGGKTWLGCFWLITSCYEYPETKWFIGREELKRLRDSALLSFWKACRLCKCFDDFKYNGQDNYIEHRNGSRIDLLDLKYLPGDPLYERYGSLEYTSGWLEEAGEVRFEAYDVLKSRVNRHLNDKYGLLGKMFLTSNPKKGWLKEIFYDPWRNDKLPENLAFIQAFEKDNPFNETGTKAKLESIENEAQKQRLLYGNWDYEDEPDQLITYEMVHAAVNRNTSPRGARKLGVDVARYGDDESVLAQLVGDSLVWIQGRHGLSIPQTADWAKQRMVTEAIGASGVHVDGVGMGAGVVDILKEGGFNVREIVAGARPIIREGARYKFRNFRSQMWWNFREMLLAGDVSINVDCPKLIEDLTAPKYTIDNEWTVSVEKKEKTKERLGRSTDYGDAVVMAYVPSLAEKQKPVSKADLGLF